MDVKVKPLILVTNGSEIVNTKTKADLLYLYFATQSTLDDIPRAFPPLFMTTPHRLENVTASPAEVKYIISILDIFRCNGPDLLNAKPLKRTGAAIGGTISKICNLSFETGRVPQVWKEAKKGERDTVSNYRPILLLSIVGKLQEKYVFERLYDFCEKHTLLTWQNSGFKPKDSDTNQLLTVTHQIYNAPDHVSEVDISKAFDRVWYIGLLHKRITLGVCGRLIDWLSDYLSNRN